MVNERRLERTLYAANMVVIKSMPLMIHEGRFLATDVRALLDEVQKLAQSLLDLVVE